jgi:hypothetical protein
LCQPKYEALQSLFAGIEKDVGHQIAFFHNSQEDLVPPEDLDPSIRNLVVFDDVLLDKQTLFRSRQAR